VTDAKGVAAVASDQKASLERTEVSPVLFRTDSRTWLNNEALHEEVFGPASMVVQCEGEGDLLEIARSLPGTLTATIHGTPEDLERRGDLIRVLETKAGRILFNGFPTGVEVSPAMHHGGPYPATADAKFTSVGTAAILRFLRPICYQNFPQPALPEELRDENPRGMWRTVNGSLTRDPVKS
jgi:NADP-dependent aldehyde dehydrogenase